MKKSNINNFTRGTGVLENLLSSLRAQKANSLIDDKLRLGRVGHRMWSFSVFPFINRI